MFLEAQAAIGFVQVLIDLLIAVPRLLHPSQGMRESTPTTATAITRSRTRTTATAAIHSIATAIAEVSLRQSVEQSH